MEPIRRPFVASRRQLEVARARCATGSRKDAATLLGISVHTVRNHLKLLRLGLGLIDDSQICYALAQELRALPTSPSDAAADTPSSAAAVEPNGA